MRPVPPIFSVASLILAASLTGPILPRTASAQNRNRVVTTRESPVVGKRRQIDTKPLRPQAEEAEPDQGSRPAPRQFESEPWVSPQGERLVGVVNERFMTKKELDARVAAAISKDGQINLPDARRRLELEEKRRTDFADSILDDWIMNTTLSLDAQRRGFTVTNEEIDAALTRLAQAEDGAVDGIRARVKLIGLPEAYVRQEVRDALLVEKFISNIVKNMDRSYYQKAYQTEPAYFVIPPKVHAYHIFKAIDPLATDKQRKALAKQLEGLRKELARKDPDLARLTRLSDADQQTAIGDMGWISADAPLAPELANQLFRLSPGETSQVFSSEHGVHVVKVINRVEGSGYKFEDALPQIENYLFGRTKPVVFESIRSGYKIHVNSGGLTRYREKGERSREIAEHEPRRIGAPAGVAEAPATGSPMSIDEIYKNISAQPAGGSKMPPPPPPGLERPSGLPPAPQEDRSLDQIYKSLPSKPGGARR